LAAVLAPNHGEAVKSVMDVQIGRCSVAHPQQTATVAHVCINVRVFDDRPQQGRSDATYPAPAIGMAAQLDHNYAFLACSFWIFTKSKESCSAKMALNLIFFGTVFGTSANVLHGAQEGEAVSYPSL
jgi:hypothetical protein